MSWADLIERDPDGARFLTIPGLLRDDGSALRYPFDPITWLTDFKPEILRHRLRAAHETNRPGPYRGTFRANHRALCRTPRGLGNAYWLLTFGWIFEPRADPGQQDLPFLLHPRQMELMLEIHDTMAEPLGATSSLAVEKSRSVGATWIDSSHHIWGWQFEDGWSSLILSTDYEAIDKRGDPSSWMWKMDYLLERQPAWLLPTGFSMNRNNGWRNEAKLVNLVTGASIVGIPTTENVARSTRVRKASIDEASFNKYFDYAWTTLYAATDHRFAFSSASQRLPHFYWLVHGINGWKKPRVFRMEWHAILGRDAAWLAAAREGTGTEEAFEREVLINWEAGASNLTYPHASTMQTERLTWRPDWLTIVSFDDGWEDDFVIGVGQVEPMTSAVHLMATYVNNKRPIRFYGSLLRGEPLSHPATGGELFDYDGYDRWFMAYCKEHALVGRALFYGDRHGANTALTDGLSPYQILEDECGIWVQYTSGELNSLKGRRDALREVLPSWHFHNDDGAPAALDALRRNRLPERRPGNEATSELKADVHDMTSHYTTMLEYAAINHLIRPEQLAIELDRNQMNGYREPRRHRRQVPGEILLGAA